MKVELFPFQQRALTELRAKTAEALGGYHRTHAPNVVSFTAPTGAGKTIIMASLIEAILFGDETFPDQPDAVFIWLSDSPQLNEQSKMKIDAKADKIRLGQTVTVAEDSFDQELFEDGRIYFLNTQKLAKSSNLTRPGDRNYTIWETLANTAREKSDRLHVIIDEAHRGMQGREAGKATTIMQKFLKGSEADGLPPMPVVIGMSATSERFNRLVGDIASTIHKVVVGADEVRASGLLKDKITIHYPNPEENAGGKDMAVLQAAADDWKKKCEHWRRYCAEQRYAQVNPIFVVQVLNGAGDVISETDLDDCLRKIEEKTGFHFEPGQVAHTFGQTAASLTINGLEAPYVEPSRIAEDDNIRVVFFKENLSTGWDCPRAETMMSFRRAKDATYIAQLLGRMVRTPMGMRIQADETLNEVHLFLPHFDEATVKEVVRALKSPECGEIPTEIGEEPVGGERVQTLTVKTPPSPAPQTPDVPVTPAAAPPERLDALPLLGAMRTKTAAETPASAVASPPQSAAPARKTGVEAGASAGPAPPPAARDDFDREEVMRFINDAGLLSYNVRPVRVSNYLSSYFSMAHLLTMSGLHPPAIEEARADVVGIIRAHVEALRAAGKYDDLVVRVKQFKLAALVVDVFGESVDKAVQPDLFVTTDADIDRQFDLADRKLGGEGIGNAYGRRFLDMADLNAFKIDVIIFAADSDCMTGLHNHAKERFHRLNDEFRRRFAKVASEQIRRRYDDVVSDGDPVSKHNFRLPETIRTPRTGEGREYRNHLFVNADTGTARINLNGWEAGVIAEEERREDFVCWIRNPPRTSWALCIPYKEDMTDKPTWPDFIVVRKEAGSGYVIDILEPHLPDAKDNLGKARGFAEYARQNPGLGRIQLIREEADITGKKRFKRLDMAGSAVRDKVARAMSNEELDHIFDTDGFFM